MGQMLVPVIPFAGKAVRSRKTRAFEFIESVYPAELRIASHAHERAYLGITISGAWDQTYGGLARSGGPWTVTLHPAGETHSNRFCDSGARILNINIGCGQHSPLSGSGLTLDASVDRREGKAAWLAREIYHEFRQPDEVTALVLEGLTLELLAELLRPLAADDPTHTQPWLMRAKELIRERFAEPLRLESIANYVGVHPVHLSREFHRHFRTTVGQQIRRLRIERACRDLSRTQRPLVEIALALGFADQSSFTKAFRRLTGLAPSEFRRLRRLR
jgi:AraC family transcriptional regulator